MASPGSPRTILVCDDNPAHVRLLELVLGAHNYDVVTTCDGHEALTYLQSATPDAIILDVQMPYMSGFDVARRLRRLTRLERVPILFLTSLDDATTQRQAAEVGAHALMSKPVSGSGLLGHLARV